MRLVCPNCGAQYEVDDRVIPESGRDVQCSACGHAWYQVSADREDEPDLNEAVADEVLTRDEPEDEVAEAEAEEPETEAPASTKEPEPEDQPEPSEEDQPEPAEDEGEGEGEEVDDAHEAAMVAPRPREIDEGVRSILKEEAERELGARSGEQPHEPEPVETQPELGLESGPSPDEERRRIARERLARMRGMDEEDMAVPDFDGHAEPEPETTARPPHGRELFPDIEEINSTLDRHAPGSDAGDDADTVPVTSTNGFRRGFLMILFIMVLLAALYVLAPNLAENAPPLEPALAAYVDAVNTARAWLDDALRGLIAEIESMTSDS